MDFKMLAIYLKELCFAPKSVNDDARQLILASKCDQFLLATEHTEGLFGVLRHIKVAEALGAIAALVKHLDLLHFIHAIVADLLIFAIVCDEVIILIVPRERKGADTVDLAVVAQHLFLFHVPIKVLKRDLSVAVDRLVNIVSV